MTQRAPPKLLLIDDEPALAAYLAEAARLSGYKPLVAIDDQDFKARLVAERPQMVALDLGMPGMDGVELLRFLAMRDRRRVRRERHTEPVQRVSRLRAHRLARLVVAAQRRHGMRRARVRRRRNPPRAHLRSQRHLRRWRADDVHDGSLQRDRRRV